MLTLKQKEIREHENREAVYAKVKAWQNEHNTTGLPSACRLGLEVVGRSYGVYGANGTLFRDLETGELYGVPARDETIYL